MAWRSKKILFVKKNYVFYQKQAVKLVTNFSKKGCQFDALNVSDIIIPPFLQHSIPQLT